MFGGYFIGPGAGGQAELGGVIPQRLPRYLNSLWAQSLPPGSPYSSEAPSATAEWTENLGRPWAPPLLPPPGVRVKAALGMLANWRPQAVVADATVSSPLGEYLTKVLGPPTASVDGLIGWQLSSFVWPPATGELPANS